MLSLVTCKILNCDYCIIYFLYQIQECKGLDKYACVCVCVWGGGGGGGGINLQGLETHIMFVSNATTNFHHGCNIHDVWTRKLVIVFHNCCLKGNNGPHGNTTKKSILKKPRRLGWRSVRKIL